MQIVPDMVIVTKCMTKATEQRAMNFNPDNTGATLSDMKIAIVGLGLMGGSLAKALKNAVGKLVGIDQNADTLKLAAESGIVDEATSRLVAGISKVDLVVLAVPVQQIVAIVNAMPRLRPEGCMLLDLGSTKSEVSNAMAHLPETFAAIGGHPMCGRELSGLSAAKGGLFDGETFVLCRNERTTPLLESTALELVARIGSHPLFIPAERHDSLVAASSHLPYVVASVLMNRASSLAQEDDRLWQVSASGLRDTTRLSGSSPEMMLEIMMTNRQPLLSEIEAYQDELTILFEALRQQDSKALRSVLSSAREARKEYLLAKYGPNGSTGKQSVT